MSSDQPTVEKGGELKFFTLNRQWEEHAGWEIIRCELRWWRVGTKSQGSLSVISFFFF